MGTAPSSDVIANSSNPTPGQMLTARWHCTELSLTSMYTYDQIAGVHVLSFFLFHLNPYSVMHQVMQYSALQAQ